MIALKHPETGETVYASKAGTAVLVGRGYTRRDPSGQPEGEPERLEDLKRPALEARAIEAGIENPADVPNKRELIAAIRAAESAG